MGRKVTPRKKKEVAKPQETKNESLKGDGLSVEDEENKQTGDVSNGDEKKETVVKMEVDVEPETGDKPNEAAAGDDTTSTSTVSKPDNATEEDGDCQVKEEANEENEEETSATDEAVKEGGDNKTEETKNDKENGEAEKPADEKDTKTEKAKKPKHPVVWVSNISRSVKATDLKKHFSQHGKVVTAKIVTNGRSFFGYVCLDSIEAAEKCVQSLNNSDFEGRNIIVSIDKPDRDERIKIRNPPKDKEPVEKVAKYDPLTTTYEEPPAKKTEEKEKSVTKTEDFKKRPPKSTQKLTEEELQREVANCEREIDRLRSRLIEEQAHCRMEVKRRRRFERELGDAEMKIREDRKKFEREREEITKKNRLEQLRLDADRVILERDRMELTRQRAEFERDLRRFVEDQQRAPVRVPTPPRISKRFRADDDSKDGWNIDVDSGPERHDPPKGGSYFRDGPSQSRSGGSGGVVYYPNQVWNNGPPGVGSSGSGQWRSMTGPSQGSSQSFFRNESSGGYRGSSGGFSKGSGGFSKGPGGFRGTYDSGSGGNF